MQPFLLNKDKDASIIAIGQSMTTLFSIKEPSATIYIKNVDTKKEYKMIINSRYVDVLAINIPAGSYEIDRWVYDACRVMQKDKSGRETYCSSFYGFKGKTKKLERAKFKIKKGETLYLGDVKFEVVSGMLMFSNGGDRAVQRVHSWLRLKDREVKNISNTLDIEYWKFEPTGYKGLFEF
jgi:hypothetical protein